MTGTIILERKIIVKNRRYNRKSKQVQDKDGTYEESDKNRLLTEKTGNL